MAGLDNRYTHIILFHSFVLVQSLPPVLINQEEVPNTGELYFSLI